MDALGHQELLESLSHNSGGSRSSSKPSSAGRSYASHNGRNLHSLLANDSHGHGNRSIQARSQNTAASGTVSHVDEAYRRLGQRLSFQAHGDFLHSPSYRPIVVRIKPNDDSAFEHCIPFASAAGRSRCQNAKDAPRNSKAQKVDYSDHGNHQTSSRAMVFPLKNLTVNAKETFQQCFTNEEMSQKIESIPETLEVSSAAALSKLDLAGTRGNAGSNPNQASLHPSVVESLVGSTPFVESSLVDSWRTALQQNHLNNHDQAGSSFDEARYSHALAPPGAGLSKNGLLTCVLEENASASSGQGGGPSHQSQASRTISTKDSPPKQSIQIQRGRCLTNPSTAVANEGYDNAEGNLIVHDNDVISVSKKAIKSLQQSVLLRDADYRVVSLLGQGTFAQVFQCVHVQTGNLVAVKIVKNKPAYTRQAGMEVDVFRALQDEGGESTSGSLSLSSKSSVARGDYMVNLECYFFHRSHLCLVFEQLSLNLYEVLKRRQFRGFPLSVVRSIIRQAMAGLKDLSSKSVVHCDMKPENVLMVSESDVRIIDPSHSSDAGGHSPDMKEGVVPRIKLIDFGSACFEGYSSHTYIQSRFYRSPEVLVGIPYDSAIDMWSLGCVAAELFLGLPILPGVHEHDQLGRITEMIAPLPDWMLEGGSKTPKYFLKRLVQRQCIPDKETEAQVSSSPMPQTPSPIASTSASPVSPVPQWRLKTQQEYVRSLTGAEIQKKGGIAKLEKQPGNRYFKYKRLVDIVTSHAHSVRNDDEELLPSFVHFLYGLLDPDPWKRWTAFQAIQHPFLTGDARQLQKKSPGMKLNQTEQNLANLELDFVWQGPWDPSICRRKLLSVQKLREKQSLRRSGNGSTDQIADFSFLQAEKRRLQRADPAAASARPAAGMSGRFSVRRSGVSPVAKAPSSATSSTASVSTIQPHHQPTTAESAPSSTQVHERDTACDRSSSESLNAPLVGYTRKQHDDSAVSDTPTDFTIPMNADFARTLSRPGVIPSAGSVTGDSFSVGSTAFSAASISQMTPNVMLNHANPSSHPLTWSDNAMSNMSAQAATLNFPSHFSKTQPPSSQASSISMPEAPPLHVRYQHGQYYDAQNTFAQGQLGMQEQHPQWHSQVQNTSGQDFPQFQPLPIHQQPVYLSLAPGGGYYYVTSSAMGQQILLQPVAVLDQPMQPIQSFGDLPGRRDAPYQHVYEQGRPNYNAMPNHNHGAALDASHSWMPPPQNLHQQQHYGRASHQTTHSTARSKNTGSFRGGVSM
jgi:dual specificity protein kinase YAK1